MELTNEFEKTHLIDKTAKRSHNQDNTGDYNGFTDD